MTIVVFVFYCILFSWLLNKIPFVKKAGLGSWIITGLFLVKVLAGVIYGYLHFTAPQHVGLTDTWKFFYQGVNETNLLRNHPFSFFKDLLPKEVHNGFGGLLSTSDSYWNDIKHELMVKFASVLNLFTGSSYYSNIVWYNFITMAGPVALYRSISPFIKNKFLAVILSFLVPSNIFWSSGFHKEGLCYTALSLIFYVLVKFYKQEQLKFKHGLTAIFSLIVLLLLRNNLLLPLVPASIGLLASMYSKQHGVKLFLGVQVISVLLFFLSPLFGIDLPGDVSSRQKEFIALGGRTAVEVPILEPDAAGFLHNLPSAFNIGFLKPYLMEGGMMYLPFTLEIWAFILCVITIIFLRLKPMAPIPIVLFCFTLTVFALLMIGYTVPNIGAVVRYRSVVTPFMFAGLLILSYHKNLFKLKNN